MSQGSVSSSPLGHGLKTNLCRNVLVEVSGVLWILEFRTIGSWVAMNVLPVNASEPWVSLQMQGCAQCCGSEAGREYSTLIKCAPSTLLGVPDVGTKPLLLACMTIEFGRTTDDAACDPSLSSGSHRSCCMRLIPSCDTRGRAGNFSDCRQLRIFCLVRWRCRRGRAEKLARRWKKRVMWRAERGK